MSGPVKTIYIELRASAERLQADMVEASKSLDKAGASGQAAGKQISDGMVKAHESLTHVAEKATEAGLAIESVMRVAARYSTVLATSGGVTQNLADSYRALRIALDPTPFTVAAVAVGMLTERTINLTLARAKLIEQQSLIAAKSGLSFASVDRSDSIAGITGGSAGTIRSLQATLQSRGASNPGAVGQGLDMLGVSGSLSDPDMLAKIARGFASIEDPVKRASAAVKIFGADSAGLALEQLNSRFASASDAATQFAVVMDAAARDHIYQFRHELEELKSALTDFSSVEGWWQSIQKGVEVVTADVNTAGLRKIADLIGKIPGAWSLRPQQLSPAELAAPNQKRTSEDQGIKADDLFAQAQVAKARHDQETLAGMRAAAAAQRSLADDLYKQLEDDQKKRAENPKDASLLPTDARSLLTQRQQSASQQSTILDDKANSTEARQKVQNEDNLTAAIGRGYQAKRAANIENELSVQLAEKGGNAADLRGRLEAQYDATHRHEIAETIQQLRDEIELERTQAAFQEMGAEAVRKATLEVKIAKELLNGATSEQIKLEREADAARKGNSDAAAIAGIEQRIAATERLTDAIKDGPGAVHNVELSNKYDEMGLSGHAAQIPATKVADKTDRTKSDAEQVESLQRKIELTDRLTIATKEGADAVARVTLENSLATIARGTSGDVGAVSHLTVALDAAEKRKKAAEDQAAAEKTAQDAATETNRKLDMELEAVKRLAAAVGQGAEARRRAEMENRLQKEASASEDTPVPGIEGVTQEYLKRRSIENVGAQTSLQTEALGAGGAPQERVRQNQQELDALSAIKVTNQNALDIEESRNSLTEQRLQDLITEGEVIGANVGNLQLQLATMQAMDKLTQWQSIGAGTGAAAGVSAAVQLPGQIGNSLASSIFNAPQRGQDKGQEVAKGLVTTVKNSGDQLASKLISDGLQKMLAELVIHTGLQALLNSIFPAVQTAQTTAITGAIGLSTTAIVAAITGSGAAGAGASVAGGIAGGVGSAAGAAGSAASSLAGGLMGPLISAAGGIIGGIISGVMSLIGDNRIVKAVDGTTAAVLSLRGATFGTSGSTNSLTPNGTTTSATPQASSGIPIIGGLLQSIFGVGGGSSSQPIPVAVMSINPLAFASGFFKMLGFADGTDSAPGGLSWVGERGPELMNVPRGAQITPNHALRGFSMPTNYMTAGGSPSGHGGDSNFTGGNHTFNIYESTDARETARQVATFLKTQDPSRSPFAH